MILGTAELLAAAGDVSLRELLVRIGANHTTWSRCKANGIPLHLADRWAERIHAHPAEVWPNWVDVVLAA